MARKNLINRKVPKKSIILPHLIPLIIPGFEKHSSISTPYVLSFNHLDSQSWFYTFVDIIERKIGREYFPVMRLSDGEYKFILGLQPPTYGDNLINYLKFYMKYLYKKKIGNKKFNANTLPGVSSGSYNIEEVEKIKKKYSKWIKIIAESGILALHLTYSKNPFQEQYHFKLNKWLSENNIMLNSNNYFPFYFVYALLRGSEKHRILFKRNILVLHSAKGSKREKIRNALLDEGVNSVNWIEISSSRSLFDEIEIESYHGKVDLALVGAGVGKPNILVQLEKLKVPCIDAGFVFEVWADENNKWLRPMMVSDDEWNLEKVRFI